MNAVICPDCRGERRIKGMLCERCGGDAQINRTSLKPGERAPFEGSPRLPPSMRSGW